MPTHTDRDGDGDGDGDRDYDGRGDGHSGDGGDDFRVLLSAAGAATSDVAVITDAGQAMTYLSPSFTAMTGYEPADLLGRNCRVLQGPGTDPETILQIRELLVSEKVFEGQILNYRKDGSAFWSALKIVPMRFGAGTEVTHYASVQRDISNMVATLRQLEVEAIHDHVTGLPNRTAAERAVDDAVQRSPDLFSAVAVCLIDLDDFRNVNNTLGHAAGDVVLQQWATRVLTRLRAGDVLARMGGDEFLLILGDIPRTTSHGDLTVIMDLLHEAVQKPFAVEGHQVRIGMSLGIALVPEDGTNSHSILRSADEALYAAKSRRGSGASWWETAAETRAHPSHAKDATGRSNSEATSSPAPDQNTDQNGERSADSGAGLTGSAMYRHALRNGNVVVHFQPIIDIRDGSLTLFEALARLRVPGGRITNPDEFLPHLDATDLRVLFDSVLDQGLALIAGWDQPGVRPNVAVNLPPEILQDENLVASVEKALDSYGIEPGGLGLELLESQILTLETQRVVLQQLANTGIRLAMDDLGSGYSSLQRLSTFPFSAIKLDRGLFLHAYDRPLETLSIMATLIQMGRDLGMTVVVEGLEDEALTEAATILGAPLGQGYYFARPMPAKDCGPWVDAFTPLLHRQPIQTPLGALAYHWQFARLAAPHTFDLEHCPLTRFINTIVRDPARGRLGGQDGDPAAGSKGALMIEDGIGVETWHALHHTPAGMHPTVSSRLLIDWLTRQIRPDHGQDTARTTELETGLGRHRAVEEEML